MIDAVGMEATGHRRPRPPSGRGMLPDALAQRLTDKPAIDRTAALVAR